MIIYIEGSTIHKSLLSIEKKYIYAHRGNRECSYMTLDFNQYKEVIGTHILEFDPHVQFTPNGWNMTE